MPGPSSKVKAIHFEQSLSRRGDWEVNGAVFWACFEFCISGTSNIFLEKSFCKKLEISEILIWNWTEEKLEGIIWPLEKGKSIVCLSNIIIFSKLSKSKSFKIFTIF